MINTSNCKSTSPSALLLTPNPCPRCHCTRVTVHQHTIDVSFSWEPHAVHMVGGYTIECDNCQTSTRLHRSSHKLALQAWNRGDVV